MLHDEVPHGLHDLQLLGRNILPGLHTPHQAHMASLSAPCPC